MSQPRSTPSSLIALTIVAALVAGCGDDSRQTPPTKVIPVNKTDGKTPPPKPIAGSGGKAATSGAAEAGTAGSGETGDLAADDTGAAAGSGGEQAGPAHPGPCKIEWTSGPKLTFKYTKSGGTVRIDSDKDGKADICGKWRLRKGKASSITVDEGCDKSTELTIKPKYDQKANLATAKYTQQTEDDKQVRDITLVTMPSFTGLDPGFPLYAKKSEIDLTIKDKLVRKAHVTAPSFGTEAKIDFTYDDQGRIKRVREDTGADGSIDKKFDYRYDAAGNVTKVTLSHTVDGKKTKATAKLDYSCWQ